MATPMLRTTRSVFALIVAAIIPVTVAAAEPGRPEKILEIAQRRAVHLSLINLDAALRLLALNDSRGPSAPLAGAYVSDALNAIVHLPYREGSCLPGETMRDAVTRWLDPPPFVAEHVCGNPVGFEPWRETYGNLTGYDWPLEWRTNDSFWRDFAVELLESGRTDDPAAVWRRRIADDPQRTELYRLAYLEVVRSFERPVDRALIEPLLLEENSLAAFDRVVLVRSALSSQEGLAEWRDALDARVLQWLTAGDFDELPRAVSRHLARWAHVMPQETRQELLGAVVDRLPAEKAKPLLLPLQANDRAFLSKTTDVKFRNIPLGDALRNLSERVVLPLWFDAALQAETPVTRASRGPWLQVLEDVLAGSPFRVAIFEQGIIWVGPADAQDHAEALVARALGKAPPALLEPVPLNFAQTPWQECLELLGESTNTSIVAPWIGEQPAECTFECGNLPGAVGLELLARSQGLDWLKFDRGTVVVMPVARRAAVKRALDRHRLRSEELAALGIHDKPLWESLRWTTAPEVETLDQLLEYTQGLEIKLVLPLNSPEIRIPWMRDAGMPWTTCLTVALLETGLTWDTDGELVFVGTTQQAATFRARAARRAQRREQVSAEVAKALCAPVDLSLQLSSRGEIADWLRAHRVSHAADFLAKPVTIELKNVPLEAALDVLTLQLGLDWAVGANGIELR